MNSKASRIQVENPAKACNYSQNLDVSRCFCWMMAICFCRSTVVSWCFLQKNTHQYLGLLQLPAREFCGFLRHVCPSFKVWIHPNPEVPTKCKEKRLPSRETNSEFAPWKWMVGRRSFVCFLLECPIFRLRLLLVLGRVLPPFWFFEAA